MEADRIDSVALSGAADIHGTCNERFAGVQEAFAANLNTGKDIGASVAVFLDGEPVVDLWGGIRRKQTGEPWQRDTMVIVHSATKGLAAMTLAIAHSRGWLDYEERVCRYWPEFAQHGKERITVRQLLARRIAELEAARGDTPGA